MSTLGIQHYGAFLFACLALSLTPGLDTFYILRRSGREGHAVGLASALGINAGCIAHTLAAALGISAILMASALAFSVLKYLGAAYLVWIGARMLLSRVATRQPTETRGRGLKAAFRQGMLTNVLNPKIALFYLAFLPQFVSTLAPHPQLSLMVLGLTYIGTNIAWTTVLALMGARIYRLLTTQPRLGQWMDRLCGTVLLGFGVKVALQQRA